MTSPEGTARLPTQATAIIQPSLQAGAACGVVGFIFGGTSGILKAQTPFLFATASGIQTFILGSAFWATRTAILNAWDVGNETPSDRVKASAIGGALSGGAIALITRGRKNVLPATVMWSLIGGLGQMSVHRLTAPREQPTENLWTRLARKSWSPVSVMSDDEYAAVLKERMLKIDVEIAMIDDKIAALKKQEASGALDVDHANSAHSDVRATVKDECP